MSSSSPKNPKALKIKRALKSAARLPSRVSGGRGSGRNNFSPVPGEHPIVTCRLQVLACKDLLAKDKNGYSDPFVVVSLLSTRHQTPVSKRNRNPVYNPATATFDFPIYLSLAEKLGVVELVIWDKDVLRKDYLGEVALPLEDWFRDGRPYAFEDPKNQPFNLPVLSTRANTPSTGTIQIKLGFVMPPSTENLLEFDEIFSELVRRSRPSLVSAPPTEGVGTVRSHQGGPEYQDDGGLSSEEGEGNSDEEEDEDGVPMNNLSHLYIPPTHPSPANLPHSYSEQTLTQAQLRRTLEAQQQDSPPSSSPSPPDITVSSASPSTSPSTPTPASLKTPKPSVPSSTQKFVPRMRFARRSTMPSPAHFHPDDSPLAIQSDSGMPTSFTAAKEKEKKKKFRTSWSSSNVNKINGKALEDGTGRARVKGHGRKKKKVDYSFGAANDIVGIVMLEIKGATDLPRLKNMTRTGWDMDPFVVISFGKKVFRTRVIRHSRNPIWDEKLLFHVRRYETSFKVQLTILDWDKLSSNDYIGEASFDLKDLLDNAPQQDPETGLYDADEDGDHPMKDFDLKLTTAKEMPWEAKHNPVITFRAKYQPYDALRQRFWRQYLKQYDTDDTGFLSHLELTSMLDSLGSTLTRTTVNSFFTRFNKQPHIDELSFSEAIQCLETELGRPDSERKRIDADYSLPDTSVSATPILMMADREGQEISFDDLDFSGPSMNGGGDGQRWIKTDASKPQPPPDYLTEPSEQLLAQSAMGGSVGDDLPAFAVTPPTMTPNPSYRPPLIAQRSPSYSSSDAEESSSGSGSNDVDAPTMNGTTKTKSSKSKSETSFERVINVKNCPLCHRPRMNSKAEVDIVTHLAVCASQDWNKVDRIVVGNFVTASQAQRKWYTKIISKVSSGDYRLGANSANIIVQNRITGQLEEEKMQVYVRLGIRLLYKGAKSRMEGGRARRLLKSLSIKQGIKYDDPASAADIPTFIEFHKLNMDEVLDPIDSFKTFNQFFYRKLKMSARPVEQPENPYRLVSAADCRLMTFETVSEATRLWIKGREFTVGRLLGDAYRGQAEKYAGGALAIFRLAPQDYHRFHSPVDGTIGPMTYIAGEYYTVNPQAIRTALDVYGENARKIVPIDSPQFGRVMAVCIGAMMVGTIKTTVEEGEQVKRGQEFGYFAFGGSTIVLLFEKGVVEWDEDLLINGHASLETLVRVGMGIGTGRRPSPPASR